MIPKNKHLLVIAGPTAVGKTETCLNLAKYFQTEIISSDSRQFYKEMDLGTAKPNYGELSAVPHHFINSLSIHDDYDVGDLNRMYWSFKNFSKHELVLMTGGSGLYIDAVCHGFDDIPDVDPAIRQKLISDFEENGIEYLQKELQILDPDYYQIVDKNNPQRLMRGLEVSLGTGKPFSSSEKAKRKSVIFTSPKSALKGKEVYQRIDLRMDSMIEKGYLKKQRCCFLCDI